MKKSRRVEAVLAALDARYPYEDKCYLNYEKPYELLFATILSAQCTDDRVNIVTAQLFAKYQTLEAFASANLAEMEQDVKPTGFFRNKAKSLVFCAQALLTEYGGDLPSDIDVLTKLPGVGRKTANVVRCHIFGLPSVVVDTHVKRISGRLGFTKNTDPVKIEFDLMKLLPKTHWIRYNHQLIAFGREICKAPKAKCRVCFMPHLCPAYKEP
ncbi:MAG: endonuclease III [Clostridiales bacterium]|jgi:endonuclease-3|nr:endonuclease III [Clostridiales bacterium]